MYRVEEVNDARRLSELSGPWRELLRRAPHVSIFDTYEWLTAWLEAFWRGKPLRYLFVWRGDELVGMAPLLSEASEGAWCRAPNLLSTPHPHSYRANIPCAAAPEAVLDALATRLATLGPFPRVAFPNTPATAALRTALPAVAARHGLATAFLASTPSPVVQIEGDWASYLRGRSGNLARQTAKKVRSFHAAGRSELVVVEHPDQCPKALADCVTIERNSWKEGVDGSLCANAPLAALHARFALSASRSGLLRCYLLYLDSQPVAYVFGAVFKGDYYLLKTSYDQRYQKLSPGVVVLERLFRDAFDARLSCVDLGPGAGMRWKNELANGVRECVDACLFSPMRLVCQACKAYRAELKPFLKTAVPGVVDLKRRLATGTLALW